MSGPTPLPGFLTAKDHAAVEVVALPGAHPPAAVDPINVWHWGLDHEPGQDLILTLSKVVRDHGGAIPGHVVAAKMRSDPAALARLLPPFAAVRAHEGTVTMVADSMGFQPLFHTDASLRSLPVMSSSCLMAAKATSADLDHTGVAVQSLLGWQLGQRSLFKGIRKLDPGAVARCDERGVHVAMPERARPERLSLDRAVHQAAALLRGSLNALLDDHPDATLQLTGGMDSRLLLSAIPVSRRNGLLAMTLDVPGSGDVPIARAIAERYGIRHVVHGLTGVQELDPAEAWARCVAEAVRLDAMSDPVALAAQRVAEESFKQDVRISGLGGEIARGFYYLGRVAPRTYSRADSDRLAAWRMLLNEAAVQGPLTSGFTSWARGVARKEVFAALTAGGSEWFRATDHLYLRHRMQRWAGPTDTAVSDQRVVINPMLDPAFLEIADRLTPGDKAGARFLAALQMELDPELGQLRMAGRPSPAVHASPPLWQPALEARDLGIRAMRKGLQRLKRGNRPPAGGTDLSRKVVELWRERPTTLEPLAALDFVAPSWVEDVLSGSIEPRPSAVALVTNLLVATAPTW